MDWRNVLFVSSSPDNVDKDYYEYKLSVICEKKQQHLLL